MEVFKYFFGDNMSDVNENLEKISQMFKAGSFEPFIKFIEFSSFKNFQEKTRLTLDFPITVLVGGNGTNKSSILKALESCCPDKIISNRWFSTDVDAISHEPVPQFWYAHNLKSGKEIQEAQVLVAKYKRDGNPDYWEKARPLTGLGMDKLPDDPSFKKKWGVTTRWPQIDKKVSYLTFRETISAFDKFFYYGDTVEKYSLTASRKKHIRRYSKYLNKVIVQNLQEYTFRNKQKVISNYNVNNIALKYISEILQSNYTNIQIVEHTFFNCTGITCKIKKDEVEYTEAFAGSGEFAVIKIVHEILKADPKSLILLDEPEVSLHPGAQTRLKNFLLEQCKLKQLQIVIATHSPTFIEGLPNKSIKTLHLNPSSKKIEINDKGCNAEEAFFHLGHITNNKIRFIVEDKLAKSLIEYATNEFTAAQKSLFEVEFYKGGAFDILNNFAVVYALAENYRVFLYLDGDQRRNTLPDLADLTEKDKLQLSDDINKFCDGKLDIPQNSNMSQQDKIELNIKIIKWLKSQVIFLPTNGNPESLIWERMISDHKEQIDTTVHDPKLKFRELAIKTLPLSTLDSDMIYFTQLLSLKTIPQDNSELIEIRKSILEKITS